MALPHCYLVLGLASSDLLQGCECYDCNRVLTVAYIRVRTVSSTGALPGVNLSFESPAFLPETATTGSDGSHTFEVLEAVDGQAAMLIISPPSQYAAPPPQELSLAVHVEVLLEPAP